MLKRLLTWKAKLYSLGACRRNIPEPGINNLQAEHSLYAIDLFVQQNLSPTGSWYYKTNLSIGNSILPFASNVTDRGVGAVIVDAVTAQVECLRIFAESSGSKLAALAGK
jgi:hypothetical protein